MEHSAVITQNHKGLVSGASLLVLLLVATLASPQQARADSEDAALAVILGAGLLYAAHDNYRDERRHRKHKHKRRDHHDNAYRYNGHRDHGYRYSGRHDTSYRHSGHQRHNVDRYYDRGHQGKSHGKHGAKYDRHARFDNDSAQRGGSKHRDRKPGKHNARDHSRHQPVWEGSTRVRMNR